MTYENELYSYEYPISWERRNKNYLKKVHNRKNITVDIDRNEKKKSI